MNVAVWSISISTQNSSLCNDDDVDDVEVDDDDVDEDHAENCEYKHDNDMESIYSLG